MSHWRRIAVLFFLAVLVLGTAGYDAVESDRSVDISTATDEDAYLGIEREPATTTVNNSTEVLTLSNNYVTALDVSVQLSNHTTDLTLDSTDTQFTIAAPDATGTSSRTVAVTCDSAFDDGVAFSVSASAPNASVRATVTARVTCT